MNYLKSELEQEAEAIKQEIRDSKCGLLKILGIELMPIAMGAALGGIGRSTGENWVPAVPVAMDLIGGGNFSSVRGLFGLAKYSIGVALAYTDMIYQTLSNY